MIKVFRVDTAEVYKSPVTEVAIKTWKFPGGEVGVQLEFLPVITDPETQGYVIYWSFESNEELFLVANIKDAIESQTDCSVSLILPYVPYARQDRVCNEGESFALRVFAQMLNALDFSEITCYDVHSEVSERMIKNLEVLHQAVCSADLPKYDYVIAPDAGAAKKIYKMRQVNDIENPTKVIVLSKTRRDGRVIYNDLESGTIPETAKICVVDDISDGNGTFVALGEMLAKTGNKGYQLDLYVTHGIFSKGLDNLRENYNKVYTSHLMNKEVRNDRMLVELLRPIGV